MNDMVRIIRSGDDHLVPLPEGYRFDTIDIRVTREGNRIVLEPANAEIDSLTGMPVAEARLLVAEGLKGEDEPWSLDEIRQDLHELLAEKRAGR